MFYCHRYMRILYQCLTLVCVYDNPAYFDNISDKIKEIGNQDLYLLMYNLRKYFKTIYLQLLS